MLSSNVTKARPRNFLMFPKKVLRGSLVEQSRLSMENCDKVPSHLTLWEDFLGQGLYGVVKTQSSVQLSLATQSFLTLWDPMNRSMPGLPVHHQLPEFTETRVHQVSDAIQPSHPLSQKASTKTETSQRHPGVSESTGQTIGEQVPSQTWWCYTCGAKSISSEERSCYIAWRARQRIGTQAPYPSASMETEQDPWRGCA